MTQNSDETQINDEHADEADETQNSDEKQINDEHADERNGDETGKKRQSKGSAVPVSKRLVTIFYKLYLEVYFGLKVRLK